jgi:hypothetical protein
VKDLAACTGMLATSTKNPNRPRKEYRFMLPPTSFCLRVRAKFPHLSPLKKHVRRALGISDRADRHRLCFEVGRAAAGAAG